MSGHNVFMTHDMRNEILPSMAFLSGCWNFAGASFIPILVVLVKLHHGSSVLYGAILTIGGVGGILGALLATLIQKRFRFGKAG